MVLSGGEIRERLGKDVHITPFQEDCLNPNSYNLTLHDELLVYEEVVLDTKHPNRFRRIQIPEEGMILSPGQVYLGRTAEYTETHNLVPMLAGRTSIARLGLFVHCASGFGDVGFCGHWTIEMFAVQPIRIYAGLRVCQIFYHELTGSVQEYKSDKYQYNRHVQPSLLYKEFGHNLPNEMHEYNVHAMAADCGCIPATTMNAPMNGATAPNKATV